MANYKKKEESFMAKFCKYSMGALIIVLVTQIFAADERSVEGKVRAVFKSETSDTANTPEKKMMCKKIKVTGSHLKTRVCLSAKDWEHLRRKTQQQLDDITSSSASLGGGMKG